MIPRPCPRCDTGRRMSMREWVAYGIFYGKCENHYVDDVIMREQRLLRSIRKEPRWVI